MIMSFLSYFKQSSKNTDAYLFDLISIIPNIIAIIIFVVLYHYFLKLNILVNDRVVVYWTVKILIAYNIISAARYSLLAPTLALAVGLISLFTSAIYDITLMNSAETWQLIMVALVGFAITILLKL